MNLIYGTKQVMHRIRVKLYPNYLPGQEKTFIARTNSEATLNVEEICAALRDRGGFTGNYNDLLEYVKQFNDEAAYQLCDGYTVTNGYYSVYPNLGGTFKKTHEPPDPQKNPLTFRFRPLSALRNLAQHIHVEVEGLADSDAYIDEFTDTDNNETNSLFTPGNLFSLTGNKIKIAGDDPSVGMYFVDKENPSTPVKVDRLNDNSPSKLAGLIPDYIPGTGVFKIEIRTQFSGSNKLLKTPRVITSDFELEIC